MKVMGGESSEGTKLTSSSLGFFFLLFWFGFF